MLSGTLNFKQHGVYPSLTPGQLDLLLVAPGDVVFFADNDAKAKGSSRHHGMPRLTNLT